jgi:4-hydroxy-2-oxoheptanedioate aldolase
MRPSRILATMRAGGVATCAKLNLADPRVVEIAARCGFECIWVDMEHVPSTLEQIENQVRAAKMYDADLLVRVKRGSYSDLVHPLEMDATGIMVPHLMSAKDAAQVAWFTRFHPVGRRPLDGGNADGAFCMLPMDVYLKESNEQRFVIVQIEDPEPLKELDEIAATPGIDMIFFGPGDFSQGIGAPAQWDHPLIDQTRRRIPEVARRHGKFAGTVGAPEKAQTLADMGYQFVNVAADVIALSEHFTAAMAKIGKVAGRSGSYESAR